MKLRLFGCMWLLVKCFNLMNAPDDAEVMVGMIGIAVLLVFGPCIVWFLLFKKEKQNEESTAGRIPPSGTNV
jgi:hypothetical protein